MPIRPVSRDRPDAVIDPPPRCQAVAIAPSQNLVSPPAPLADAAQAAAWNPSHETRFGGHRQNIRGTKPKGTKNMKTIIAAIGDEIVEVVQNGRKVRMPRKAAMFRSLSDQGFKGNVPAIVRALGFIVDAEIETANASAAGSGSRDYVLTQQDQETLNTLLAHLGLAESAPEHSSEDKSR
jgi:hypothetical protein